MVTRFLENSLLMVCRFPNKNLTQGPGMQWYNPGTAVHPKKVIGQKCQISMSKRSEDL